MAKEKKFKPVEHYKKDKKGEYVLDKNNCKIKLDPYRATTFEEMVNWLKENGTEEDKKEFKENCYLKKVYEEVIGKKGGIKKVPTGEVVKIDEINVLYAKEKFFEKYAPEYMPKAKEKENKKSMEDLLSEL